MFWDSLGLRIQAMRIKVTITATTEAITEATKLSPHTSKWYDMGIIRELAMLPLSVGISMRIVAGAILPWLRIATMGKQERERVKVDCKVSNQYSSEYYFS